MIDCTQYGPQELSLNVMNDEYYYKLAYELKDFDAFMTVLNLFFTYTEEQKANLEEDYDYMRDDA